MTDIASQVPTLFFNDRIVLLTVVGMMQPGHKLTENHRRWHFAYMKYTVR